MYYLAVDMLTGESLGRYPTYADAVNDTLHLPSVDIQMRGRRK